MTRPRDAHPIGEPPIKIMSREVWVPVEDKAAWARADTTGDVKGASVVLKRRDNGEEITLPQAEFAKLALTTYSEMDDVVDDLTQVRQRAGCVCDGTMRKPLAPRPPILRFNAVNAHADGRCERRYDARHSETEVRS